MPALSDGDFLVRLHRLQRRLTDLRCSQGNPALSIISRQTKGQISKSTVGRMFSGLKLPKLGSMQDVVKALGGDLDEFTVLWREARAASSPGSSDSGDDEHDADEPAQLALPATAPELDVVGARLAEEQQASQARKKELVDELRRATRERDDLLERMETLRLEHVADATTKARLERDLAILRAKEQQLLHRIETLNGKLYAVQAQRADIAAQFAEVTLRREELQFVRAQHEERARQTLASELRALQDRLRTLEAEWLGRIDEAKREASAAAATSAEVRIVADAARESLAEQRNRHQAELDALTAELVEMAMSRDEAAAQAVALERRGWLWFLIPASKRGGAGKRPLPSARRGSN